MSGDRCAALPTIVQQSSPIRKDQSARTILEVGASISSHHLARTPRQPLASLHHRATGTSPPLEQSVGSCLRSADELFLPRKEREGQDPRQPTSSSVSSSILQKATSEVPGEWWVNRTQSSSSVTRPAGGDFALLHPTCTEISRYSPSSADPRLSSGSVDSAQRPAYVHK